jgi:chitin disaccharide deacetylase
VVSGARLIVNADDLGMTAGVNAGIRRAHEHGIVTSTSLMVLRDAVDDAVHWAASAPSLSVGMHIDLTEWTCIDYVWHERYRRVDLHDELAVDAEVRRQLDRFVELMGQLPTHLDTHQHIHFQDPVGLVVKRVAAELGVPVRDRSGIKFVGDFYGQSGKGYPMPEMVSVESLLTILAGLRDGWFELGCHPGLRDDVDDMYRTERSIEAETLCDARVRKFLITTDIILATFRDFTNVRAQGLHAPAFQSEGSLP